MVISQPSGRSGSVSPSTIKLIIFAITVLAVVAAFKYTGMDYYFSRQFVEGTLQRLGIWAPVGFIAIYAVATVLGVPGTILTVLGGVIFGSALGTFLVVVGATIGATGAFFVARFLARDFIAEKFGKTKWFKRFDEGIEAEGLYFMLFVRLVPVFPFNGLNYASGLTKIRFRDYFIGTFVGIIPASFVFVNAASKAADAAAGEKIGPGFFISLVLLGLIALLPVAYKKYKSARSEKEETDEPKEREESHAG